MRESEGIQAASFRGFVSSQVIPGRVHLPDFTRLPRSFILRNRLAIDPISEVERGRVTTSTRPARIASKIEIVFFSA